MACGPVCGPAGIMACGPVGGPGGIPMICGSVGGPEIPAGMPTAFGPVGGSGGMPPGCGPVAGRSEEHTSELQSRGQLVCRLLLEKKKKLKYIFFLIIKNESTY